MAKAAFSKQNNLVTSELDLKTKFDTEKPSDNKSESYDFYDDDDDDNGDDDEIIFKYCVIIV